MRRVTRKFGFKEVDENEDWTLFWTDYSVSLEKVINMKSYQVQQGQIQKFQYLISMVDNIITLYSAVANRIINNIYATLDFVFNW